MRLCFKFQWRYTKAVTKLLARLASKTQEFEPALFSHVNCALHPVQRGALLDVRQRHDLVDAVAGAIADQLHHELVVGDAEVVEAPQPGTCIHQEIEQVPAMRLQHFAAGKARGVGIDLCAPNLRRHVER